MLNALLGNLRLRQKFILLAGLAAAMVSLPTVLFLNESRKAIEVARLELRGVPPARAVLRLTGLVQQHRGLSAMQLSGDVPAISHGTAKRAETQLAFEALEPMIISLDDPGASTAWRQVRSQWQSVAGRVGRQSQSAEASFREHSEVVAELYRINLMVLDRFALRLDPEPDSYFIIDSMLVQAPILRETLAQMRGFGSGLLVSGKASVAQRMWLNARTERAIDYYDNIGDALTIAMRHSLDARAGLEDGRRSSRLAGIGAIELARQHLLFNETPSFPAQDYFRQFSSAIDAQQALSDNALDTLERILSQRVAALEGTMALLVGAIALLLVGVVGLSLVIIQSVLGPVALALRAARLLTDGAAEKIDAVQAIAEGKLERRLAPTATLDIDLSRLPHDEVGELVTALVRAGQVQGTLDQAFERMTAALRLVRADDIARDWQKTGLNELGDLMRGDHDTLEMADRVLCYLALRLGAQMATFLLADGDGGALRLAASYAMTRRKEPGARIGRQALADQAVREKKIICIVNVPPDYLPIRSGLGEAQAHNVVAIPLLHGELLVGVIELASFGAFTDAELDFIERARERIAVGFDVNQARHRMGDLLVRMQHTAALPPAAREAGSIGT